MARPLRIQFPGAWYHVMNRGLDHNKIFFNDHHRELFLKLLYKINKVYGIEIHAYCLMGNHYHLILHTPRGNLGSAMQYLNSFYAQKINSLIKRDGPLFKGRYKAIIVSAEDYLLRLSRYIHRNPAEMLHDKPLYTYKWSSYPSYIGKAQPPHWLATKEIMLRFKKSNSHKNYKDYVENTIDKEIIGIYEKPKIKPVLGSEEYCNFIFDQLKSKSLSPEITGKNNIISLPDSEFIIGIVSKYFKVDIHHIKTCSHRIHNPARRATIYLLRKFCGYKLNEIAKIMDGVSYTTISNTISRTQSNKKIMRDIEKIRGQIFTSHKIDASKHPLV